jgi:hypothetical protein
MCGGLLTGDVLPVAAPRTRMRSYTSPVAADSRVINTRVPIGLVCYNRHQDQAKGFRR